MLEEDPEKLLNELLLYHKLPPNLTISPKVVFDSIRLGVLFFFFFKELFNQLDILINISRNLIAHIHNRNYKVTIH